MNTRKQAFLDATPMQVEIARKHLAQVLAVLRAQYLSYQTSHWQVISGNFYGNHLLFERLYKSVQEQVDQLAEKMVGYFGREAVNLAPSMKRMLGCVLRWNAYSCHHKRGIASEVELQEAVQEAYDAITESGAMTLGLDDWLMATANQHEENTYLLQQAVTPLPHEKQAARPPQVKIPRRRKDLIGFYYALHDALEKDINFGVEDLQAMSDSVLRREVTRLAQGLEDTPGGDEAAERALKNAPAAYRMLTRMTGVDKLAMEPAKAVAPTAEGHFFDNPSHREVQEFADSDAISNIKEVTEEAAPELDIPESEALKETAEAPPTPVEIAEEPGGKELSTLNRLEVKGHDARMAAWEAQLRR